MAREIETKYDADTGTVLPSLDVLPGVSGTRGPDLEHLEAEYYDTADMRLLRSGITLRRRKGGHDAGWHLKLPAEAGSREEIMLPLGRAGRRVPAELADLVKARTRGAPLAPVATIRTLRQATSLLGADGESLAEVADDQVSATTAAGEDGGQWREVEVELTGGGRDLLSAADKLLKRAGLRRSGRSAKLQRVLGWQAPDRPGPLATPPTAANVVLAYLREHADRLIALDPLVRRQEPAAVHKMRVATRRLRSTLRTFATVTGVAGSEHVIEELKWLGTVLGDERDAEVQGRRLAEHVREADVEFLLGPVGARVQAHVAKDRATTHAAVAAVLNSARYYSLLDALDALMASPVQGLDAGYLARTVMSRAIGRSYRRTHRRMRAALREPAGPARDTALHAARKAAKRTRYAAEAAVPACGKPAGQLAAQMKRVQSVLGDYQDTVVSRRVSRRLGVEANLAGESAFSYGLFYGRDACAAAGFESRAEKTWQRASKRKYRGWLA